jgi:hypothetical protein
VNNIDSQINDRMNTYAGNPQGLMQRYAQTQELVDLLALQKMKNDRAAATNAVQGAMQPPPGTVKGQLEQEAMQGARNDVLRSMAPGIQQQGVRTAQMQNRAAMGLPAQPAPNMARMAQGGIVGYQQGGNIMGPPEPNLYQRMGQGLKNYGANAQESMGILKAVKAGIGVPYEERSAVMKQVRDEIAAQNQNRDPNFIERMGQKLMNAGLNVEESKAILKKFYDTFGKTYEEMSNGMAMGGEVKRYQTGAMVESDESRFGIEDSGLTPEEAQALDRERRDIGMVYGPFDIARDIRDIIEDLPSPQRIPREAILRRDMIDMTGAMAPSVQARRIAEIERRVSELPPEERMPRKERPLPQNEGITAGMYDVRGMTPTAQQKLGSMVDRPSAVLRDNMAERAEEKPKSEIDFRALREFLTAGGGQTSIAGALGAGARGLGAYQTAEQGRQDKINQAAAELQLKRDLAVNEARMLTQKLMADYEGKITTAEIKVAQEALERLDDPLNQEYQSQVKAIREQFARQPIEMENALNRLREAHVQRAVSNVRRGVGLGSVPTTSAAITDMGLE